MSETKKYNYPELWDMWLNNLCKEKKLSLQDFLDQCPASENVKETLRLMATGGDY